jgi:Spy/CpxP family protein refolding chaperone
MRKLTLLAILVPALAVAAPQPTSAPGADRGPRADRMQKHMRLARAIGLAEALDLDDAAALRVRDVLARYDEKRAPLREQARASLRILRDAAHGDQAAAGQVDASLQRVREARNKLQQLDVQMLDELAKGLTPERKARAALFLATFHHGARHFGMMSGGGRGRGMGGRGMGGPMGGGPGMRGACVEHGMMMPGQDGPGERQALTMGDFADDEPELEGGL